MPSTDQSDIDLKREMRRYTRRGFLSLGVGAIGAYLGWEWIRASEQIDGAPWVLRKGLELNETVAQGLYSSERLAPTFDRSEARMPRVNGTAGLEDDFEPARWKLQIVGAYEERQYQQYVDDVNYEPRLTDDDDDTGGDEGAFTDDDDASNNSDESSTVESDTDGSKTRYPACFSRWTISKTSPDTKW